MARTSRNQRLLVYLNARFVGVLERAPSGAVNFAYDPAWLDWPEAIPVSISLPLTGEAFRGSEVTNVFENLLPDTPHVRKNIAMRLGAEGTDAFSLLAVSGRDCVGALQFLSKREEPGPAGEVRGEAISEAEIAERIRKLKVNPLGLDPDDDDFRISIAGAQDKTALLKVDGAWMRPVGTTATTHILKPAIGVIHNEIDMSDSVENEFICMKLCAALGLNVAETVIETFEDQRALSVTRFDRLWTHDGRLLRLPQEDFCQALCVPSSRKYQKDGGPSISAILERLKESDHPNEDRFAFFKAQIVFWLIGASDGHAKNFSIALRPRGRFVLAPLYDILSAQPVVDAGRISHNRFTLAMSVGNNNRKIMHVVQKHHFEQSAAVAGMPKGTVKLIMDHLEADIPSALEAVANLIGNKVPEALVNIGFWLIGASDGHAKNFSIALRPRGRFVLAPLYDILSAQPVVDAGRISHNRFTLAMSVGNNNRKIMHVVQKHHFEQSAAVAGMPKGTVKLIMDHLEADIPSALEAVANLIGNKVPEALVNSITKGVKSRLETLLIA